MCAKIDAQMSSHLFPVIFCNGCIDIHVYVHNASSHNTAELHMNGVKRRLGSNRPTRLFDMPVLLGQRDAIQKLQDSSLHKYVHLIPLDTLAMGIVCGYAF